MTFLGKRIYQLILLGVFVSISNGVLSEVKFDSKPELVLARMLETENYVHNWLRPAPQEFNTTYNRSGDIYLYQRSK